MLAIEIDGDSHDHEDSVGYDRKRQVQLETLGVQFLRFDDIDVKKKIAWVLDEIEYWIKENSK